MTNGRNIQAPAALLYGPSGVGKTVAVLRALTPERTVWISTERGALKPAGNPQLNPWHPRRPREVVCLHVSEGKSDGVHGEMLEAVEGARALVARGEVANVVIDTLSSYARRLDHHVRTVIGVGREYGKAADAIGAHLLPYLDRIYELCATVRRPSGVWGATVVALCHERDPFQPAPDRSGGTQQRPTPGGPDLPGALAKKVRHDFDLVLRCDVRRVPSTGRGDRVFAHDSMDKMMPTKDRWGIVPDAARGESGIMPMDLGALLRAGAAMDAGRAPQEKDVAAIRRYAVPSEATAHADGEMVEL